MSLGTLQTNNLQVKDISESDILNKNDLADLLIVKTANPNPVLAGNTLIYTIVVSNLGPACAQNVELIDLVKDEILNPEVSRDEGKSFIPWSSPYIIGNLSAGSSIIIKIRGRVKPDVKGIISNTATVSSTTEDPNELNNNSKVITQVNTSADILLSKTVMQEAINAGEELTSNIAIENKGPSDAQNVMLMDINSYDFLNQQYSIDGGREWNTWNSRCNIGTLHVNEKINILIKRKTNPAHIGTITNNTIVKSTTLHSNVSNNTSTTKISINALAHVYVTKQDNPREAIPGELLTYTIVVSNDGPSDAQNVILTEVISDKILKPEYSIDGGLNWNEWSNSYEMGTLLNGKSIDIKIRGLINESATGTITNISTVSSTTPQLNDNDNKLTTEIPINIIHDVPSEESINDNVLSTVKEVIYADLISTGNFVKTVNKECVDIGDEVTYTIKIKNTGNTIANNVVINNIIKNGTSYVVGSLKANVQVIGTPENTIKVVNGIDVEEIVTLSYRVKIEQLLEQDIISSVSGISYTYLKDTENLNQVSRSGNSNTVIIKVNHGEILAEDAIKLCNRDKTTNGDIITYKVQVKNTGNVDIDAIIKDQVPEGTEFIIGTVIINGILKPEENPNVPINIGIISGKKTAELSFKVKVLEDAPSTLISSSDISYSYSVDNKNSLVTKSITTNMVNVKVIKAKLTLEKFADTTKALVGEKVRYSIKGINTGECTLKNIKIKDLSYCGNLVLNGISYGEVSLKDFKIESLNVGEEFTVDFDAKVIGDRGKGAINNIFNATFDYIVGEKILSGIAVNNEEIVTVYNPKIKVTNISSKQEIKIGYIFEYNINIENAGDIEINNVIVKDDLPSAFEVVDIKVDGILINENIKQGINVGTIESEKNKNIDLTVKLVSNLPINYRNIAMVTGEIFTNNNNSPIIISEKVIDNKCVNVVNPQLVLTTNKDKKYAAVGETVTYMIVAKNIGDITLGTNTSPIIIYDLLNPSLKFLEGSVMINGITDLGANIINGVDIGELLQGQSKIIIFKAKVISAEINPIISTANAIIPFKILGYPQEVKDATSNSVSLISEVANIDVIKKADKDFVVLNDIINYTVEIKNTGNMDAINVVFKDDLSNVVKIIDGTLKINDGVIKGIDIRRGFNVGIIKSGSKLLIQYAVKVIKGNCELKIKNAAKVKFKYIFPDGSIGNAESKDTSLSQVTISLGISNFKQLRVEENLIIPMEKPDMENILAATGQVEIIKSHIVETPIIESNERQKLTGYKAIVHGVVNEVIEYTALDEEQRVHSAHYSIPFTTFIVLPEDYCIGYSMKMKGDVEDIDFKEIDPRRVFTNASIIVKTIGYDC